MDSEHLLQLYSHWEIQQRGAFYKFLSDGADHLLRTGQLPPSPFDPPVAPWDPSLPPYSYGPQQHAPDPGAPGAAQVEVQSAADVPRRKPRARRGTRAPTGYNLFVKEITDQQHADGRYSLYPDSQTALKSISHDWKNLAADKREEYQTRAADAAKAVKDAQQAAQQADSADAEAEADVYPAKKPRLELAQSGSMGRPLLRAPLPS